MLKNAAFYRNLARLRRVASRKIDTDFATVNGDKVHRGQFGMRQIANLLCETETLEHRPARWVQTIAAHLFSGKSFPLENKRVQSSQGTTCCTGRSGRAAPHDHHVENLHPMFNFVCHVERSRDISDSRDQIQRFLDFARNDKGSLALNDGWRAIQYESKLA